MGCASSTWNYCTVKLLFIGALSKYCANGLKLISFKRKRSVCKSGEDDHIWLVIECEPELAKKKDVSRLQPAYFVNALISKSFSLIIRFNS